MINILDIFPSEKDFIDEKYRQELWFDITDSDIEGIIPGKYKISTWGRIIDLERNIIYPTENLNIDFYPKINIKFTDGTSKSMNIHSIVVKKFCPITIPSEANEIDHKDCIKYHNWVWNLERVTHQENLRRAVSNNLYKVNEEHQNALYTNDQIHMICQLISEGYSPSEIRSKLIDEIPNLELHTIDDIKVKRIWKNISDQYDFSNMYRKSIVNQAMDIEIVEKICFAMQELGSNKHPRDIVSFIGIDWDSLPDLEQRRFENLVRKLRRRVVFKEINKKYNY